MTAEAPAANPHQPAVGTGSRVDCSAPECHYSMFAPTNSTIADPDTFWAEQFRRHHADQYEPGRAPDITVEWEISASCSVCEDGVGDVVTNDSESVTCKDCGTTWSIDGTSGERAEADQ